MSSTTPFKFSYKYRVVLLLHALGHRIPNIAAMLGLSSLRIQRFINAYSHKTRTIYRISDLKGRVEQALEAHLTQHKDPCDVDTLLKYVQAIEKLGDTKKISLYTLDAYEQLIERFLQRITSSQTNKRAWFDAMQYALVVMSDAVVPLDSPTKS